jgi:hypothetical protein
LNATNQDIPSFRDHLVVTSIPEGCPGADDQEHPVVYDSDVSGDVANFTEPALPSTAAGPLMNPVVGPFLVGSYRLTVTLADDLGRGMTTFDCIEIVKAR